VALSVNRPICLEGSRSQSLALHQATNDFGQSARNDFKYLFAIPFNTSMPLRKASLGKQVFTDVTLWHIRRCSSP
jgi:hypothetical protein